MAEQSTDTQSSTVIADAAVREFAESTRGEVVQPGDGSYDEARRVWNGMIDKHPRIIARCADVGDVCNAVNFAREHDLITAVRGGGHGVAGNAVCDDGMVIDLSLMKGVEVDPHGRRVSAGGGVTWGEYDRATAEHGLASTGGLVSTTGIAGFTLGGGIGWLMRKYGLACDNLVSAQVVTADSKVLNANSEENSDLFWGLCGGGGNFGVVTAFEFQLHPVRQVVGGLIAYPFEAATDVFRFTREFAPAAPDELTMMPVIVSGPPAPFIPQAYHGKPISAIALCCTGDIDQAQEIVRPIHEFGSPIADIVGPMPYTAVQTMLDATAPRGTLNYWKAGYLSGLPDECIQTIVDFGSELQSPLTQIHVTQMGGAAGRVPADETAFSHRDAPYLLNVVTMWASPADTERNIDWARRFFKAMEPYQTGGVYVNFLGKEGDDRVRAAYGDETYSKLAALKKKFDPTNFFRLNQNIRPLSE